MTDMITITGGEMATLIERSVAASLAALHARGEMAHAIGISDWEPGPTLLADYVVRPGTYRLPESTLLTLAEREVADVLRTLSLAPCAANEETSGDGALAGALDFDPGMINS